jgi:hypothetical protein
VAVFEHVLDSEIFYSNEGVGVDVPPSRLVRVILTLAGDLEVLFGRLLGRFAAAVGTPFFRRALLRCARRSRLAARSRQRGCSTIPPSESETK